jgi:sulfonate dioxygenase
MSTVQTITEAIPTLTLRPATEQSDTNSERPSYQQTEGYRYAQYLPVFVNNTYPPLEPFEFSDPGARALQHANPRSFLDNATSVTEITPHLGTEVTGVQLSQLSSDQRDQLALEVSNIK